MFVMSKRPKCKFWDDEWHVPQAIAIFYYNFLNIHSANSTEFSYDTADNALNTYTANNNFLHNSQNNAVPGAPAFSSASASYVYQALAGN